MYEELIEEVKQEMRQGGRVTQTEYGKYCDHTVLRAYTPTDMVRRFVEEAIQYGAASVCVNPIHVPYVAELLRGTGINTCTVIGFPLGANKPAVKAYEAKLAVEDGATEVDMVLNIGALKDNNYALVYRDIKGVVDAAAGLAAVKVIIETCYLSSKEIVAASLLVEQAGADYVKTSTGFGTDGARVQDVKLIRSVVSDKIKIKASTNVNTREDAKKMVAAGAVRLGTSRTPQIVTGDNNKKGVSSDNQPPKQDE